jgi:hypothetical protein
VTIVDDLASLGISARANGKSRIHVGPQLNSRHTTTRSLPRIDRYVVYAVSISSVLTIYFRLIGV